MSEVPLYVNSLSLTCLRTRDMRTTQGGAGHAVAAGLERLFRTLASHALSIRSFTYMKDVPSTNVRTRPY